MIDYRSAISDIKFDIVFSDENDRIFDNFIKNIMNSDRKERGTIFNAKNYDTVAKFDCVRHPARISAYNSEYSKRVIKYAKAEKNGDHMYYFISFED